MRRLSGVLSAFVFTGLAAAVTMPKHSLDPLKKAPPTIKTKTPKEDKKISAKEQKEYKEAMAKGRQLHKSKKYKDAVASFEQALLANPDDARAMSELGYAAYFTKDYTKAEEYTRKSIERTSDQNIRGASLYNLGLILEALTKKEEAIDAYVQSLEARPNGVVREALGKLDATKAARFDPVNPVALAGPYKTLDDWCKDAKKEDLGAPVKGCYLNGEGISDYKKVKASGPYKEVRVVSSVAPLFDDPESVSLNGPGELVNHLAILTSTGWYVEDGGLYVYNPGAFGIFQDSSLLSLEIKDVIPGDQPELLFTYAFSQSDHDMAGAIQYYSHTVETIICGVGASGAPGCTNPIITKSTSGVDISLWDEAELGPPPEKSSESTWNLSLNFTSEGKLELKQGALAGLKSLPKDNKASLGSRALIFP
jgi:tetratricopeptide (TPR) repeat protein